MDFHFTPPIHPGEILREEFMVPLKLTAGRIARDIGVPRSRIERLARAQTALTADTAARLACYFRTSTGFWMALQTQYETDCIHANAAHRAALDAIKPLPRPDLDAA